MAGSNGVIAPEVAILGRLMLAFRGRTVPSWLRERLGAAPAAGVTLFRAPNVRSPDQVRRLTGELQAAARRGPGDPSRPDDEPLLIATDQEGGQLLALGDGWTPFAGPMAIGATGDAELAERVGRAIGTELRAVGVNVDYAPVMDVATAHDGPATGIRSFGDQPGEVARLGSAWLRGLQSAGVAATLKHFPGHGDIGIDPHLGLGVIEGDRARLEATELVPFRAGIGAGAKAVMSGHVAAPALSGSRVLPATLSRAVMDAVLREQLGFEGVTITDALDMRALPQDAAQAIDVVAALEAGVDLLLCTPDRRAMRRIESAVARAALVGLLDPERLARSAGRIQALRRWLGSFDDPSLDVVGGADHRALARELGARSLTLVRDDGTLPLRLAAEERIAAIMPAPMDLTPADTSSTVAPGLAAALRAEHHRVDEFVTSHPPTRDEVAGLAARAADYDALVVGTIAARPDSRQAELVEALRRTGRPLVTVALRTPWDLAAYPAVATHVCTYSILPESLAALAAALFGRAGDAATGFPGRLPVAIPGIAEQGHRAATVMA